MIRTAKQLKDLIRNLSQKNAANAQVLMRNYMMERFLERISLSEYRDKFILKGGMLVAAIVGLDARSTMDLDATIKGAAVNVESIKGVFSAIISIPVDDGVAFQLKNISEIMEEAEYPGVRVGMIAAFDGVIIPLKVDISTGDVITPKEIRYRFKLMLEDRSIDVLAYNLEQLHSNTLNAQTLRNALLATARNRGTLQHFHKSTGILAEIKNSPDMQKLWEAYRRKFSYASDLEWAVVLEAVCRLYALCTKESS